MNNEQLAERNRRIAEGVRRSFAQGRRAPNQSLSAEQVLDIKQRLADGQRVKDIAAHHGIKPIAVCQIGGGSRYRGIVATPEIEAKLAARYGRPVLVAPYVQQL